mmetsp:Transcript_2093/g.6247  ORF Transcript_2093/g.6247 Transcript_2093/m.6247 type:complete len:200 (+) Transcript_2093:215-814(+)|eukprot:CAMPEP_0198731664 /NCGR_PEP_ID=MMETSP1475-20131203/31328_1 /TAXON_ID= ORGANISM="Unidentified sp., Strain CCMP1999" /NCGR_SAMPLE_ID=MMETSP1475 /ASSEMBLY_ACC=CAM_ASM_001111 /LENGTH=199 /DNA_ID=CAMNT_0044494657 /DNA_START=184 /DNA_END=783 /DNA_ORIENTATION=+
MSKSQDAADESRMKKQKPILRCDVKGCGQECVNKYTLRAHLRLHTGEQPFECPEPGCTRRFRWRSSLRSHRMMHRRHQVSSGSELASQENTCNDGVTITRLEQKEELQLERDSLQPFNDSLSLCTVNAASPQRAKNHLRVHEETDLIFPFASDFFDGEDPTSRGAEGSCIWEAKHGWEEQFERFEPAVLAFAASPAETR